MNLIISSEHRFFCKNGIIYTASQYQYDFWKTYLEVFDDIKVIARVKNIDNVPFSGIELFPASGDGVVFLDLPYYVGPTGYIINKKSIIRLIRSFLKENYDSIILRVPSQIASIISSCVISLKRPFALEILGDPFDVFSFRSIKHPFSCFFRYIFTYRLKQQCINACAISYVTKKYLQKRYISKSNVLSVGISDVYITSDWILNPKTFYKNCSTGIICKNITTIASLDQQYKGIDVLIKALSRCVIAGLKINLIIVGDGYYRGYYRELAEKYKIGNNIIFKGKISNRDSLKEILDDSVLFVLPSRTEGLPRAMIEAMARGLPCIGSNVGGIPELLPPEDMVPPGDVKALAQKIMEVLRDPERMNRMAERNWKKAHEFHDDILRERRIAFYRYIKEKTEEWQRQHVST